MFRFLVLGAGIVALSAFPVWADNPPGELTQNVIRLTDGGVDDAVIIAFVDNQTARVAPNADDDVALKAAGVSQPVLNAIARHNARLSSRKARPVTEAQVYRLYGGVLYHEGSAYGVGGGLPEGIKQDLVSDPRARDSIISSCDLKGDALWLTWGGLTTTVGGAVFAGVSQAGGSPSWGPAAGLSAVGLGIVSMIVGSVVDAVSYHDLYRGLYQYNEDLIHQSTGGNS